MLVVTRQCGMSGIIISLILLMRLGAPSLGSESKTFEMRYADVY